MDQYIITITKQYASLGGRIGKRVAEKHSRLQPRILRTRSGRIGCQLTATDSK